MLVAYMRHVELQNVLIALVFYVADIHFNQFCSVVVIWSLLFPSVLKCLCPCVCTCDYFITEIESQCLDDL